MPRLTACLLGALLGSACGNHAATDEPDPIVRFDQAWIRAPVAGRDVTAAYFEVANLGDEPVAITEFVAESPDLRVEMHETTEHEGMMRMRSLKRVAIPASASVAFAPGGKHLMLFGVDAAIGQATLRASLEDGRTIDVVFPVLAEAHP